MPVYCSCWDTLPCDISTLHSYYPTTDHVSSLGSTPGFATESVQFADPISSFLVRVNAKLRSLHRTWNKLLLHILLKCNFFPYFCWGKESWSSGFLLLDDSLHDHISQTPNQSDRVIGPTKSPLWKQLLLKQKWGSWFRGWSREVGDGQHGYWHNAWDTLTSVWQPESHASEADLHGPWKPSLASWLVTSSC